MMNELRERMARLEDLVGAPQADVTESLSVQGERQAVEMAAMRESLDEFMRGVNTKFESLMTDLESMTTMVKDRLLDMETDVALLKKAVVVAESDGGPSKLKVPEPKAFQGERNAKHLENFLWDMEQYFKAAKIPEVEWVTITSMYLAGDAKLWWRTRVHEDANAGRPVIESWVDLKKELKAQFLPCNAAWVARESLKNLKHTGTVRAYVTEFSSLMLDIKNMSEDDKLFNFLSGLQPWAQTELRRQGVKDLPSAMAAADGLVDYGKPDGASKQKNGESRDGKPQDGKNGKSYDGKKGGETSGTKEGDAGQRKSKGCFLCDGPHLARDCPSKVRLSAILAEEAADSAKEEDVATVTALRLE